MEHTQLTWLCDELGLVALFELPEGMLASVAAQAAGCPARPSSVELGVAALLDGSDRSAVVSRSVRRARLGEKNSVALPGCTLGRLTVLPLGSGRVAALLSKGEGERAPSALSHVAAAVSHEVANAVGAIAGWATLAGEETALGNSPQHALQLIASSARTAQEAAERLLRLARGETADPHEPIDVSALVSEFCELLTVPAREARVRLRADVEPGLWTLGSRAELFTLVWNLAKNAIEACPAGGLVQVSLGSAGNNLLLEVSDTGPGLPDIEVFDTFVSTKATGTGLGLPLARESVEALGGDLSVHSQPDQGTTFAVRLPSLKAPERANSEIPCTSPARKAGESGLLDSGPPPATLDASVLVVDDDHALREMVATALSLRGARVTTASSSGQIRDTEDHYDIALIDMMLDDCRGDELLATLRKRGAVSAAMLVTGAVKKPQLVPGGEPDDWIRKPFELSNLIDRIERTLSRHRMLNNAAGMGP